MRHVEPYTALASIYDRVMDHVDYVEWADFVDTLLELHAYGAKRILELGAGTGRFAKELASLREMRLTLTDGSAEMLRRAEDRLRRAGIEAETAVLNFAESPGETDIGSGASFDAVLLLYDGFNYALTEREAEHIFALAAHFLKPRGVFIFDHVTPANSTNVDNLFEDTAAEGDVTFSRTSEYDAERGLHRTTFEIETPGGRFFEEHIQRIWTPATVNAIVASSPLREVAAYDGYTLHPAADDSERIHRVLRRP